MRNKKILIGTSGWIYKDWAKAFYPQGLTSPEKLRYLSEHFDTVEINSSFYQITKSSVYKKWHETSAPGFVFSVKLNQIITHLKRLILDDGSKRLLGFCLRNPQALKEKLGALLVQLPPNFPENLERLEAFLKYLNARISRLKFKPDVAIEFRHQSWFSDQTYRLLKKYGTALVVSHSPSFPIEKIRTAKFTYIRLHGPKKIFASSYSYHDLQTWSDFIRTQAKTQRRVYVYFNNDQRAMAVKNGLYLKEVT